MVRKPRKDIRDVIRELGKYPTDAFQFVQEGLSYTVQQTHGEMSAAQRQIHDFILENEIELDQLEMLYESGQLPKQIARCIEEAGGFDDFNRHVSGQHLCWGLRDYAIKRWGILASTVLRHWNIQHTRDFGEIVFALVENDFLQKQPGDSIDDFHDVYAFAEAMDGSYHITVDHPSN